MGACDGSWGSAAGLGAMVYAADTIFDSESVSSCPHASGNDRRTVTPTRAGVAMFIIKSNPLDTKAIRCSIGRTVLTMPAKLT